MLDDTVTRLFQRRLDVHVQREQIHQHTLHSRQSLFNQIVKVVGILWPPGMPLIAPFATNIFAPSNLWGLCGPGSDEGKQSQAPSTILYLPFTIFS